jgi:hypothetical protein
MSASQLWFVLLAWRTAGLGAASGGRCQLVWARHPEAGDSWCGRGIRDAGSAGVLEAGGYAVDGEQEEALDAVAVFGGRVVLAEGG